MALLPKSTVHAACSGLRYAELMTVWLLLLGFLSLAAVLLWAWRRTRVSAPSDPTTGPGEKPKFETTMGDLRDLRQALRPLQKGRARHPDD